MNVESEIEISGGVGMEFSEHTGLLMKYEFCEIDAASEAKIPQLLLENTLLYTVTDRWAT